MAYTTIDKSSLHFNTVTYTGNGSAGNGITGVGFQPDLVWIKRRESGSHNLVDVVRGAYNALAADSTSGEGAYSNNLSAFGTDGFTLGDGSLVNANAGTYVAWNWKAGGAGSSNSDGDITSTVSANTAAGFSIVTHTGTGSTATIGHGLGAVPKFIITKKRSASDNWFTYHYNLGNGKYMLIEATDAQATSSNVWNNTSPTSSVFTRGGPANDSGATYVQYCFAEKTGFSKFGSYTGNFNNDGPFLFCGFRPALFVVKRYDSSGEYWNVLDNKRDTENPRDNFIYWSETNAEGTKTNKIDFVSNGIKIRGTDGAFNASGGSYIFLAFAAAPLVASNDVPANAG